MLKAFWDATKELIANPYSRYNPSPFVKKALEDKGYKFELYDMNFASFGYGFAYVVYDSQGNDVLKREDTRTQYLSEYDKAVALEKQQTADQPRPSEP